MATYPSENTQGFAALLYVHFVSERLHRVDEVAPRLDVSPSTLYSYVRGERTFPPDLIARLYEATGDRRFLEHVCGPRVVFFDVPEVSGAAVEVLAETVKAQEEHLDAMKAAVAAIHDGRITAQELARIERETGEAMAQLARLAEAARRCREAQR